MTSQSMTQKYPKSDQLFICPFGQVWVENWLTLSRIA